MNRSDCRMLVLVFMAGQQSLSFGSDAAYDLLIFPGEMFQDVALEIGKVFLTLGERGEFDLSQEGGALDIIADEGPAAEQFPANRGLTPG